MERALIIYNPRARNAPPIERLRQAISAYETQGWQIDLQVTQAVRHATDLARNAVAEGLHTVIACGGDGTLNEVVNGLANSETRLALLRGGTGNVFAKEIGVSRAPEQALRVLLEGEERRFDLGVAGGRFFLLMCGIGFDAEIVRRVPAASKRLLGTTSYVLWGATALPRYRSRRLGFRLDGEAEVQEEDLYWVLLGNTRSYGGVVNITREAVADDGLLDAYFFPGRRLGELASSGLRIVMGRPEKAPGVRSLRLRELEVLTPGVPVQADGEFFGETPMRFSVVPQALSILLPPGKGHQLLAQV